MYRFHEGFRGPFDHFGPLQGHAPSITVTSGTSPAEWIVAIATCVLALGLIGSWWAIKDNSKTRHAQIAMEMGRRYDEPELVAIKNQVKNWTPQQLCEHYESTQAKDSKEIWELDKLPNFFEDLGTLYKMKALKLDWLDETVGSACIGYWDKWEKLVNVQRDEERNAGVKKVTVYRNWENAALAIKDRRTGGAES